MKKIQNQVNTSKIIFVLTSIFLILISISCVSAASQVYVNTNGSDTTGDGTLGNPYYTIGKGIDSVDPNGTVKIANGNYSGTGNTGITISKNMAIIGQSQAGTIINGTNSAQIFHIYSNVTIWNLTFANGNSEYGSIANDGNCTVSDCTFISNTATSWGGAICNFEETCIVNDCTFVGNSASSGGGAIGNVAGGICTIFGCTFTDNIAMGGYGGGAILNGGECTVNFSRFYGNMASNGSAISSLDTMNAENNWWGSNADPMSIINLIAVGNGAVDADPWIIMAYNATPTTIRQGATSALTADFRYNSNGDYLNPTLGHLPDGAPVKFKTNLGHVGGKSVVIGTLNGVAIVALRGDEGAGEALTSANLDDQLLTAIVTINAAVINTNDSPITGGDGSSTSSPTTNAASSISKVNITETIPMQKTGIPIMGLLLAILAVFGGLVIPKRK